ncbi:hypothetical protein [Luteimonas sp. J16]|uniref:hypothetical protein n=1 Tax=Luteimonas sp. J16 TaxID=935283 RepID=UPI0011A88624|nr:hypothetical protein [Luteimonas sp. J16]
MDGRGLPVGEWGWADIVESLVERGHSLSDIKGYTLAQLRAFAKAGERARRMDLADQLTIQRAAAHYESKDISALLSKLTA